MTLAQAFKCYTIIISTLYMIYPVYDIEVWGHPKSHDSFTVFLLKSFFVYFEYTVKFVVPQIVKPLKDKFELYKILYI